MPSQSLSFLEQSLVPTLGPEELWSRRHNPAPRLHPHRSLGWSPGQHSLGAGLDPNVQGKPWFGSLGEVSELYKRAWDLGTSFLCKPLHPRKAVWGLVSSVSLRGRTEPRVCPVPPSAHRSPLRECTSQGNSQGTVEKRRDGVSRSFGKKQTQREFSMVFTGSGPDSAPRLAMPGSTGRTAKVTANVTGSWRLSPPGSSGQAELVPQLRVHVIERNRVGRTDLDHPCGLRASSRGEVPTCSWAWHWLVRGRAPAWGPRQTLAQGEFLFLTCPSPGAFMQADWMCNTGGIFLHEASKCLLPCSPTPRTGAFPLTGTLLQV